MGRIDPSFSHDYLSWKLSPPASSRLGCEPLRSSDRVNRMLQVGGANRPKIALPERLSAATGYVFSRVAPAPPTSFGTTPPPSRLCVDSWSLPHQPY